MTTDTAPIRQDIDAARQDMSSALFAIGDRIAPKKVMQRLKQRVRFTITEKLEDVKARVSPVRVVRQALNRGTGSGPSRRALPGSPPMRQLPSGPTHRGA